MKGLEEIDQIWGFRGSGAISSYIFFNILGKWYCDLGAADETTLLDQEGLKFIENLKM